MTIQTNDSAKQQAAHQPCWATTGVWGDGTCPTLGQVIHCRNCSVFCDAGQELLERNLPEDCIAQQTARIAEPPEVPPTGERSFVVFRIGNQWLAVDADLVVEVARTRPFHRVPFRSNAMFLGLVNLRGELQLCVSLAKRLGEHPQDETVKALADREGQESSTTGRFLVCEHDSQRWALIVDEVAGVQRVAENQLGRVPSTIDRSVVRLSSHVFGWNQHCVGYLERERLFDVLRECVQ